ncbi:hypothetical protein [Gordonia sp. CPCC 205333]|uniref:hypothetical protein n=1 Tax=Gordonia sp. CPCC 205333 TaxID=3140790 RepID=UPI003AF34015
MAAHDRRTIIQAHSLRYRATMLAVLHGTLEPRSQSPVVKLLLFSIVLAFAILAGILAGGIIADLIVSMRRH